MERFRSRSACVLALLATVLVACGKDAPRETPASDAGPAARWRRSVDAAEGEHPAVLEALRPCRMTIGWRFDAQVEGRDSVDLLPGEALGVSVSGEAASTANAPEAPDAERAKGRTRPNAFSLRYALNGAGDHRRTEFVWTRDRAPWSRIVTATVPPTWVNLPTGVEISLLVLGVSDAADTTGLRLDLSSPPRIASPRPFAVDDVVHVSSLFVMIQTR